MLFEEESLQIIRKQQQSMDATVRPFRKDSWPYKNAAGGLVILPYQHSRISYINKLTNRGMAPTRQTVKNLAEEIKGAKVGKNWVGIRYAAWLIFLLTYMLLQ